MKYKLILLGMDVIKSKVAGLPKRHRPTYNIFFTSRLIALSEIATL